MSVVHVVVGVVIVWLIGSPTAAVLLGRVIRGRDRQVPKTPPVRVAGEEPTPRRAHLRVVS